MIRKTLIFTLAPILLIIVAVILTAQLLSSPARFIIKNLDTEPVKVIVHWRDKTKNVGQLSPNTSTEFFVDDETTMKFEISRANGTAVALENVPFTSNTSTSVEITHTSVEVKSDTQ